MYIHTQVESTKRIMMHPTTIIVVALVTTIGFQSYVVEAFHHRHVIFPLLHSSTLSTGSFSTRATSTSLAEYKFNDDAMTSINDGEEFMEEDGPKAQLLKEISNVSDATNISFGTS